MPFLKFLFFGIKKSAQPVLLIALFLLIYLNVALLTLSGVNAAFSAALSSVGIDTIAAWETSQKENRRSARRAEERAAREAEEKAEREAAERLAKKKTTRKISRELADSVTLRVKRQAIRNSASVLGESIPILGVAIIASALAMEIKDICDNARDIGALTAVLETEGNPQAARHLAEQEFDCRELIGDAFEVPSKEEFWRLMRESPERAWNVAAASIDDLKTVNWSSKWSSSVERMVSLGDWMISWLGDEEEKQ